MTTLIEELEEEARNRTALADAMESVSDHDAATFHDGRATVLRARAERVRELGRKIADPDAAGIEVDEGEAALFRALTGPLDGAAPAEKGVSRKRAPDYDAEESLPPEERTRLPDTPVTREAWSALRVVAKQHGLVACDPDGGDRCYFPRCIADGCEAEPAEDDAARTPAGTPGEGR